MVAEKHYLIRSGWLRAAVLGANDGILSMASLLIGVAVALGAQDLFKNLISGFLIIAEKRFNIGDWIKVEGVVEGTVEAIGFRSTFVRRFDKAPVYIPNAKLSDNSLINFSSMSHRRIYWRIGVQYRTTIEMLREIRDNIENYIIEMRADYFVINFRIRNCCLAAWAVIVNSIIFINQTFVPQINECVLC